MSAFLEAEKERLARFKQESQYFSTAARAPGEYRGKPRPFCLPRECAGENLYTELRGPVLEYFDQFSIKWHDGGPRRPSNHLCDSQVCCVNFLFAFADKPATLAELLRPVFPTIRRVLPFELANQYLAHEWIGFENYLGERMPVSGRRSRGANCTSADAAVRYETQDGRRHVVLIEWKYTEAYHGTPLLRSASGTDRTTIYAHLFRRADCPIDIQALPDVTALFYEPFYQFMRQQMLAHEMERTHELDAETVTLLHIAPAHNVDFQRVTSPGLRGLGSSATAVWKGLVRPHDRFASVSTEELFGRFPVHRFPELASWKDYITARYPWMAFRREEPAHAA